MTGQEEDGRKEREESAAAAFGPLGLLGPLGPLGRRMARALAEAQRAGARGEVPVGAAVFDAEGRLLAAAGNEVEARHDPSAHAEMLALRRAARRLGQKRLSGCELVVTLEPCPMCAFAASLFHVSRLVFGAYDPKGGGVEHGVRLYANAPHLHRPEVIGGVLASAAGELLSSFFRRLREEGRALPDAPVCGEVAPPSARALPPGGEEEGGGNGNG
jgi:tRNA(adenine34) deaminase